jgi:TolA-binding protein
MANLYLPSKNHLSSLCVLLAAALILPGCLKTRAQLRGDQGESSQDTAGAAPVAGYQMEELRSEITRLNGKVEELEHKQQTANTTALWEAVNKLEAQQKEIEQSQVLIMSELKAIKDQGVATARAEETKKTAIKAKPKNALAEANQLFEQKKYDDALAAYNAILGAGVRGKDAADAHYGVGRTLYAQRDFKKAILSFSKVQESYSKSPNVPSSIYWIARCFDRLNMKKEAEGFYQELLDKHPSSTEAKRVKAARKKN